MKNPIVKTLILIAVSLIVAMLAAMISLGNASESIAELLKPILYPQAQQIAVVSELDTDRNIVSFVEWTSAEGAKHRLEYSTFAVVWTLLLAIPIFLIAKLVVYFRMKSLRTSIESSSHNIPEKSETCSRFVKQARNPADC